MQGFLKDFTHWSEVQLFCPNLSPVNLIWTITTLPLWQIAHGKRTYFIVKWGICAFFDCRLLLFIPNLHDHHWVDIFTNQLPGLNDGYGNLKSTNTTYTLQLSLRFRNGGLKMWALLWTHLVILMLCLPFLKFVYQFCSVWEMKQNIIHCLQEHGNLSSLTCAQEMFFPWNDLFGGSFWDLLFFFYITGNHFNVIAGTFHGDSNTNTKSHKESFLFWWGTLKMSVWFSSS